MTTVDACTTLERIRAANEAYSHAAGKLPLSAPEPRLGLALVTCMDARINTNEAFGIADGEAHIIRNAGGVVTDDVLRSLVVSQWALDTQVVMIVQHTGCGLHGLDEAVLRRRIKEETGAAVRFRFGGFSEVEASVRQSVSRVRDCLQLRAREQVFGFIFDVSSRALRPVT